MTERVQTVALVLTDSKSFLPITLRCLPQCCVPPEEPPVETLVILKVAEINNKLCIYMQKSNRGVTQADFMLENDGHIWIDHINLTTGLFFVYECLWMYSRQLLPAGGFPVDSREKWMSWVLTLHWEGSCLLTFSTISVFLLCAKQKPERRSLKSEKRGKLSASAEKST